MKQLRAKKVLILSVVFLLSIFTIGFLCFGAMSFAQETDLLQEDVQAAMTCGKEVKEFTPQKGDYQQIPIEDALSSANYSHEYQHARGVQMEPVKADENN